MTTVWKIGDLVYGVHTEVENSVFTVYVTEEKIIEMYDGGWKSEGKVNGVSVYSEYPGDAYDSREEAVEKAEEIAKDAESYIGNGWAKVERVYPGEESEDS